MQLHLKFPRFILSVLNTHTNHILTFTCSDTMQRNIVHSHRQWLYRVHLFSTDMQKWIFCYPGSRSRNLPVEDKLHMFCTCLTPGEVNRTFSYLQKVRLHLQHIGFTVGLTMSELFSWLTISLPSLRVILRTFYILQLLLTQHMLVFLSN